MIKSIILRGPFTEDNLARLIETMKDIEAQRPDENFEVIFDASQVDVDTEVEAIFEKFSPLRPGYGRIVTHVKSYEAENGT